DDDCDGETDEGELCGDGLVCLDFRCRNVADGSGDQMPGPGEAPSAAAPSAPPAPSPVASVAPSDGTAVATNPNPPLASQMNTASTPSATAAEPAASPAPSCAVDGSALRAGWWLWVGLFALMCGRRGAKRIAPPI